MWQELKRQLYPSLSIIVLMTALTGLAYPLIVTGLAQAIFPVQANGSLILRDGKPVGSSLIGQPFTSPKYFWARPSATSPDPDNAAASSGSNLGPTNPALATAVQNRITSLTQVQADAPKPVPVDLVTASGSGLDPDISPAAALYQIPRIAKERKLTEDQVRKLVLAQMQGRTLGVLGEPRVNVLQLNMALDKLGG